MSSLPRVDDKLALKDSLIGRLKESNRGLEATLASQRNAALELEKSSEKLRRRNKEQAYFGKLLRRETATRVQQESQIASLRSAVAWGDVGRRHAVEQTLADKTEEIERLRAQLERTTLQASRERAKRRQHAARIHVLEELLASRGRDAAAELEAAQEGLQRQLEVADRNGEMVSAQNVSMQQMVRRMGLDLVRARAESEALRRKLGSVNVLLVLQRMLTLKRAEVLAKLHEELRLQNRLVVEGGGTELDLDWVEHDVR